MCKAVERDMLIVSTSGAGFRYFPSFVLIWRVPGKLLINTSASLRENCGAAAGAGTGLCGITGAAKLRFAAPQGRRSTQGDAGGAAGENGGATGAVKG